MQRVLVVGMSGSGKSTAARRVAERLGVPFHELDTLAIGPGWSTPPDFVERVEAIVAEPGWVFDSWGYPEVRRQLWAGADTVVWLDYPRRIALPRLVRRSLRRSFTREPVFGGNVETWRSWLSRDHPVVHAVTTFEQRRRTIRELAAGAPQARLVRCEHPDEFDRWLSGVVASSDHSTDDEEHFDTATVSKVLSRVEERHDRPFVLVIDGPGGSGKSTLARDLADGFEGRVAIIEGDDFYADLDHDYRAGLDAGAGYREYFDWQRLRDQVLVPARAGSTVVYQRYDWEHARLADWVTLSVSGLLIVEGVYTSRPELREFADLVVWVTASEDQRLRRQLERGENEDVWIKRWMAAEDFYLKHIRRSEPTDLEVLGG